MKAKEIAKNAINAISDEDFMYTFYPEDFDKFCKALCGEQKSISRNVYSANRYRDAMVIKDILLNAPNPKYK